MFDILEGTIINIWPGGMAAFQNTTSEKLSTFKSGFQIVVNYTSVPGI